MKAGALLSFFALMVIPLSACGPSQLTPAEAWDSTVCGSISAWSGAVGEGERMTAGGPSSPGFPAAARAGAAKIIAGTKELSAAMTTEGKPPVAGAIFAWEDAMSGMDSLLASGARVEQEASSVGQTGKAGLAASPEGMVKGIATENAAAQALDEKLRAMVVAVVPSAFSSVDSCAGLD